MSNWVKTVKEVEDLMKNGYTIKIAGTIDTTGWWAIKNVPYKNIPSYRIPDSVINKMIEKKGYTTKDTISGYSIELVEKKGVKNV